MSNEMRFGAEPLERAGLYVRLSKVGGYEGDMFDSLGEICYPAPAKGG